MKVVLEEIEGTTARLIPDDSQPPIHVPVSQLPENYQIGQVYNYQSIDGTLHLTLLAGETESRLNRVRAKRQELLSRSKKNK